jgi:cytochrome c peroxidase
MFNMPFFLVYNARSRAIAALSLLALVVVEIPLVHAEKPLPSLEALGQALYFDINFSQSRQMACATCHAPEAGFVDPRDNPVNRAVSTGDDGHSLGNRNAPTTSYARFIPTFQRHADGEYRGGLFWDGRADTLKEQATGPLLNAKEMAMLDTNMVLQRLRENPVYVASLNAFFGPKVLNDKESAFDAVAESIAAFEKSPQFATFDSKYDRYLRGEYKMTPQEELGQVLFFSQQFTNCNQCHQLSRMPGQSKELFSNFEYHNIGVPRNPLLPDQGVDEGLAQNPAVTEKNQRGKFRVPTLRNVAVTGPYMHNGVFQDLRTVVLFYNKYNSRSSKSQINPETGKPWDKPEVPENLSMDKLTQGRSLKSRRIDALVAFLKTLTDKRYEPLLDDKADLSKR